MDESEQTSGALPSAFILGAWRVVRMQNRIEPLRSDAAAIRLEPKAMDVLCFLAERAQQTVSREELLEHAWRGRVVDEGALTRVIRALRRALRDDARSPTYIETVTKRGYRLLLQPEPDVSQSSALEAASTIIAPPTAPSTSEPSVETASPEHRAGFSLRRTPVPIWTVAMGVVVIASLAVLRADHGANDGEALLGNAGNAASESVIPNSPPRVLWVDDHPEGNREEIGALQQMGLFVETALSNLEAAERLRGRQYDLLISDIKRDQSESDLAGLDLPREAHPDRNRLPPVVYYVGTVISPRTADGYPVTNDPEQLLNLVSELVPSSTAPPIY